MPARTLTVNIEDATDRQLLVSIANSLHRIENEMSELDASVDDLHTAVGGVAERLMALITPLQQALSDAQSNDASDAAAIQAALADASAAAAKIETEVGSLNTLAQPAPPA